MMTSSADARDQRSRNRNIRAGRQAQNEMKQENKREIDERGARFRQLMVGLTVRASTGNPARALSTAASNPVHMCEALFCVLTSIMHEDRWVHFKTRGNVLSVEWYSDDPRTGRIMKSAPKIIVNVGNLPRGACGHGSDHDCDGLHCTDERHGFTTIKCRADFDIQHLIRNVRMQVQTVRVDGVASVGDRDVRQFHPWCYRESTWNNCVSLVEVDAHGNNVYAVRYLDSVISGLPELLKLLICIL